MGEAATAVAAPASTSAPPPAAPSTTTAAPASAGATLSAVPEWSAGFKDELKSTVSRFKTAEDLATAYQNLEKMKGVPESQLLRLPEKMEGDAAKAVWQKLGAPKTATEYEFAKAPEGKELDGFSKWAVDTFYNNSVPKPMAEAIVKSYNDFVQASQQAQAEATANSLKQADIALQKEWGPQYEANINLAKQGVKILGLDAKTLDLLESTQGRETLFKTLSKLGASVGESTFVTSSTSTPAGKTPEEAQAEIKALTQDRKFGKALAKGDVDATKRWADLHKAAFPGDKQIG